MLKLGRHPPLTSVCATLIAERLRAQSECNGACTVIEVTVLVARKCRYDVGVRPPDKCTDSRGGGGEKVELSSLFNRKGQAIVFSEKIGFTSKFLLSEDDCVPSLRSCFVHYFELILFHLGLCPYSCYYLFTFCLLFYSMYRIVSLLLSSLLEPCNGNVFPIPCLVIVREQMS